MHRIHNEPTANSGAPQTSGLTLHWASQYDFMTGLFGLGVNRSNSRMVVEMAGVKPGDRVLDVGCGTGNLTLTAKTAVGWRGAVFGIDAAPEMIKVACKKTLDKGLEVTFEVGLVEKIPYPSESFDVVISRLVIHHLPDDLKKLAFAEIFRVLKPGGQIFIADFTAPANPILRHLTGALVGEHMLESNLWDIPPQLSASGFVEVSSGPTRSAFLAFVRAVKPRPVA